MQVVGDSISLHRVKLAAIIDAWRRDLEALVEANKAACENLIALSCRQREALTEAMQNIVDGNDSEAGRKDESENARSHRAQETWAQALAEMKTSCESAFRSRTDAMVRISGSTNRHLQAIRSLSERQVMSG